MDNIKEFIAAAASQLGVGADQLTGATAGLLDLIQHQADGGRDLISALPGASALLSRSEGNNSGGGGHGILGATGKLLGGPIGQSLGVADVLKESGLGAEAGAKFVNFFVNFARGHAGRELVGRVLQSLPQLAKMFG